MAPGAGIPDDARSFDEVDGVVVVFFNPCRHGENVWIEDNVLRREADVFGEDTERPLADLDLAVLGVGLPNFVKRHDDNSGPIGQALRRLLPENVFALLHGDRVDDALTLHTFQAGLNHFPFGTINHHRHPRDIRLRGNQVQEGAHGFGTVQHALIHVDVDYLRAVLHLLAGDLDGVGITPFRNHAAEYGGTCHVGAFTDVHE
jgi:hypothetical protein